MYGEPGGRASQSQSLERNLLSRTTRLPRLRPEGVGWRDENRAAPSCCRRSRVRRIRHRASSGGRRTDRVRVASSGAADERDADRQPSPFQPAGSRPPAANGSGAAAFRTLPAFCRVTARLTPTPDSDIRVEVWLPLSGWNRKVQAAGNGGLGGTISYPALAAAVRAGYAAAGTDTGHVGGNADFVPGHPEKLVDFAYRAIHEMTVSAKALVAAHYDARPARAYFSSCSTGGRQALDRGAALPRGLRRDRGRRRVVGPDAALRRARRLERLRQPRAGRRHSADQVPDDPQRRAGRLRRAGRREGRRDRKPGAMHLRLCQPDLRRRRSRRLPDEAAGRVRQGDGVADRRPQERRRPASGPLLSRVGTRVGRRRRAGAVRRIARRHEEDRVQRRLGLPHDPRPRRRRTRRAGGRRVAVRRRSRISRASSAAAASCSCITGGPTRWSRRTRA